MSEANVAHRCCQDLRDVRKGSSCTCLTAYFCIGKLQVDIIPEITVACALQVPVSLFLLVGAMQILGFQECYDCRLVSTLKFWK